MKKFIIKLSTISILIVVFILILYKKSITNNNYFAASIDKQYMLKSTMNAKKRIILVGGSNVAFGISAKKIEQQLHIKTLNIGLHAEVGIEYMLNQIKPFVKENDVIIIFPEYQQFCNQQGLNLELTQSNMILSNPNEIKYIAVGLFSILKESIKIILRSARAEIVHIIKTNNKQKIVSAYYRDCFNEYGDMECHFNLKSNNIIKCYELSNRNFYADTLINRFYDYCKFKKAKFICGFPGYMKECYERDAVFYENLYASLKQNLKTPIIGKPKDFLYERNRLFDSAYHLDSIGIDDRTKKISKLIVDDRILF